LETLETQETIWRRRSITPARMPRAGGVMRYDDDHILRVSSPGQVVFLPPVSSCYSGSEVRAPLAHWDDISVEREGSRVRFRSTAISF
jgi:hypothetical protein